MDGRQDSPQQRLDALLATQLEQIRAGGLYKDETILTSPQRPQAETAEGSVLNLCANNYLGLADHPEVRAAARDHLDAWGAGMASVRFICGTQSTHRDLEREVAALLGYEDAVLYGSCFDANAGLFAAFLGPDDVILSDALNHASIIDGVRLSKARSVVYRHGDLAALRAELEGVAGARLRVIATDGVFSMEGDLAPLDELLALARQHDALLMVDDSHGVGVVGPTGRGTAEHFGLLGQIDLQTGTLGKALGGASGGYTVGSPRLVELLRQRSRPYLFSNALPPAIVGAARAAIALLLQRPDLVEKLRRNTTRLRSALSAAGFTILPGRHPIVPVMLGDERTAMQLAAAIRARGVLVVAFTHPVVPRGEARIRVQLSAAHTDADIDTAAAAFADAAAELGLATAGPAGSAAAGVRS